MTRLEELEAACVAADADIDAASDAAWDAAWDAASWVVWEAAHDASYAARAALDAYKAELKKTKEIVDE